MTFRLRNLTVLSNRTGMTAGEEAIPDSMYSAPNKRINVYFHLSQDISSCSASLDHEYSIVTPLESGNRGTISVPTFSRPVDSTCISS